MKKRRCIDLLSSHPLSDVPQPLWESDYKSDSSRYVRRTSRNYAETPQNVQTNFFPCVVIVFSGMKPSRFGPWGKATALCSCSFALLWVVCVSALLIPRGGCCWPIGSRESFFFSKGGQQMKWWDSCNFSMTPPWQRQSSSIVLSHSSLLLCHGGFCWFLCWTAYLQVNFKADLVLNLVG